MFDAGTIQNAWGSVISEQKKELGSVPNMYWPILYSCNTKAYPNCLEFTYQSAGGSDPIDECINTTSSKNPQKIPNCPSPP